MNTIKKICTNCGWTTDNYTECPYCAIQGRIVCDSCKDQHINAHKTHIKRVER